MSSAMRMENMPTGIRHIHDPTQNMTRRDYMLNRDPPSMSSSRPERPMPNGSVHVHPLEEIQVDPKSLQPGDHIYRNGQANTYTHHEPGIRERATGSSASGKTEEACPKCGYREDLRRGVVKTCVDCFVDGHKNLYLFKYGVSVEEFLNRRAGTCHRTQSRPPSEVIERAIQFLEREKDFGVYNLFNNNCEQFAVVCKLGTTGLSKQVIAFLLRLGLGGIFFGISGIMFVAFLFAL
ncbi:LRAT domain [Dillenia turbinata]|uniref:LRAT domain n=1 Tax=Dillenia turbinata TaxID=194707 RepID=A0AAN8VSY8_9MAGN